MENNELFESENETFESFETISRTNTDDTVKMYLKEIGRIPLLSDEEVVSLGRKIQAGILAEEKLNKINRQNMDSISLEEFNELNRKKTEGLAAKSKLVEGNLRLVVSVAKRYASKEMPFMDLVQEGNIGLIRAAEKYDPESGNKFSTYATWWVRQAVTRAITNQSKNIRIPTHIIEDIRKVNKAARNLEITLKRKPTDEELAAAADMDADKLKLLQSYTGNTVSLDSKIGEEDEDSVLGDFVADSAADPSELTMRKELKKEINELLNKLLTEREMSVIEKRFGLNDNDTMTLEQLAGSGPTKVTRERIRQIETQAMRKLSRSPEFRKLAEAFIYTKK